MENKRQKVKGEKELEKILDNWQAIRGLSSYVEFLGEVVSCRKKKKG